jgi:hypothetical protein
MPIWLGVLLLLQILGLVLVGLLLIWLVLRARKRSQKRRTPPTVSTIVASAGPVAAESNGSAPELVAASNGTGPDTSELEAELRAIYDKVGHPDSFDEANEKVTALATELAERDGIDKDKALRTAYRTSLAEHQQYLAAKGIT